MTEYTCEYIEGAISFNRTDYDSFLSRITFCNFENINNGLGHTALIEDYAGEEIDLDKLIEKREKIKNDFGNGIFPKSCVGCPRIEKRKPKEHNKIYNLSLASWQICNSRCVYCESEYFDKYNRYIENYSDFHKKFVEQYDILSIVKQLVKKEILAKDALIDITGGEPTMYPRFNELLAVLLEYGCKRIRILTNAIIYSPVIERGLRENAVTLTISVDAGSQGMHKKVKGVASYNLVWENIRKYSKFLQKNTEQQLDLKYILIPGLKESKRELNLWIKLSMLNGATCISVNVTNQLLQKIDINKKVAYRMMSLAEYAYRKAKKKNIPMYFHSNLLDIYTKFNKQAPVGLSIK